VTSAERQLAALRLKAAGVAAVTVVTIDDVGACKPDPEGYLLAARLLEVEIAPAGTGSSGSGPVGTGCHTGYAFHALATREPAQNGLLLSGTREKPLSPQEVVAFRARIQPLPSRTPLV
jgi:hypothetical protein